MNTSLKRTLSRTKSHIKGIGRRLSKKGSGSHPDLSNLPSAESMSPLSRSASVRPDGKDHRTPEKNIRMSVLQRIKTELRIQVDTIIKE